MEKSALGLEKVWFDKPFYEKAERLYYQQMAKVVSRKIMESCTFESEVPVTNNYQDIINSNTSLKKKTEKSKDNKSLVAENVSNDILKGSKCQIKTLNSKKAENECNVPKKENIEAKHKAGGVKSDIQETSSSSGRSNECNAKEVKEKKNKSDTRHKNKEKGKNNAEEVKENVTPLIKNKKQLPNQQLVQGNQQTASPILPAGGSLANEVAKARQHIKQSLQCMDDIAAVAGIAAPNDANNLQGNLDVYSAIQELRSAIDKLEQRVSVLEEKTSVDASCPYIAVCPAKPTTAPKESSEKDEGEDVDLFGSDSEGEDLEAAKIREERLAAYNAKKSKKPAIIAKSNIILDVKPWGDTTDMEAMESEVRKIEIDGLLWGAAKLVPLAFGIHKLQISCVVEDDKVSVDWLTEKIQEIEEHVQSVDIAAFNKV